MLDDEFFGCMERLENHLKQCINKRLKDDLIAGCIYHYSTIPSFFNGIISFEPNSEVPIISLMATDCDYLNDPKEIKYGITEAKTIYEKLGYPPTKKALSPVKQFYLTSFSKDNDSIPMWSQYAQGGTGIALGFNVESLPDNLCLYPCLYGADETEKFVKTTIDLYKSNYPNDYKQHPTAIYAHTWAIAALSSKHPSFAYEKEIRIITFLGLAGKTRFRVSNNLIVPYKLIKYPLESLRKIVVGPCADPYRTRKSIKYYLGCIGLSHVNIEMSKVPFR